ncbi:hypothetical protein [Xanthomonas albilineans]|uniref:hypothetical protein n=1 Tax=Xanthomonas albilineans TaxID=29447 RepID=UPI000B26BF9B|nr:hypothetical protein [Xanthomonas albilineans]
MKEFNVGMLDVTPSNFFNGTELFDVDRSKNVIDACELLDVSILGMEGFRISGNNRIPDMDCIVDFSPLLSKFGSNFPDFSRKSAREFIESIYDNEILIEFVLVKI